MSEHTEDALELPRASTWAPVARATRKGLARPARWWC